MITYVYETIPTKEGEEPQRFEVRQSINDEPLKVHPETGVPVRRVITGGLGIMASSKGSSSESTTGACSTGCCCCNN